MSGGDLVEKVARAIYDATDPLSEDPIAVVIHMSDHLFWETVASGQMMPDIERQKLAIMEVCRAAATEAIKVCQTQAADEIARLREEVKRLREPTPAMIEAGITAAEDAVEMTRDSYEAYRTDTPSDSVLPIYRAMIAAADDGGR